MSAESARSQPSTDDCAEPSREALLTALAASEERLRVSEERYRVLQEVSPQFVWKADSAGRTEYVDELFLTFCGVDHESLEGMDWLKLIHPDDRVPVQEAVQTCLSGGTALAVELRFRRADGEWRWFLAQGRALENGAGLAGVSVEIHERRETEQRLRESEMRYRCATKATTDLLWTNTTEGEMRGEQPGWARFTGQSFAEYQGYGWASAVHPEDAGPTIDAWRQAVAARQKFIFEHRVRRSDGAWRHCAVRALPVLNEDGSIREWIGAHTDITELKLAEERLREALGAAQRASAAKDEFLAKLSHELRTPLTPVLIMLGELMQDATANTALREDLQMIQRNVELEGHLIDDLLDVTRIINGKLTLKTVRCDLHEVLRNALEICQGAFRERRIEVCARLEAQRPHVTGDPTRLQQVFWNLFHNAAKFSPVGQTVEVRSEDGADGKIRISVCDHGLGIDPAHLPLLFAPFEQAASGVTRKFGGLGLGLAICRGIVELHGGRIWAESAGVSQGATLVVELAASF